MKNIEICSFARVTTFLIAFFQPSFGRVGYSADTPKKNTDETCESADGSPYVCSTGHCCGGDNCCTYYYELWWFWLIWGLIIMMSCCCAYHHRQKRRGNHGRRNRTVNANRLPYAGVCNYPGPPLDNSVLGYCKLPVYDDIIRYPPSASPPPPYSRRRSINTIACLLPNESTGEMQMNFIPCHITGSMLSLNSLSFYVPQVVACQTAATNSLSQEPPEPRQPSASTSAIDPISSDTEQKVPPLPKKILSGAIKTTEANLNPENPSVSKFPSSASLQCCSNQAPDALLPYSSIAPAYGVGGVISSDSEYDDDEDEGDALFGADPNNNNTVPAKDLYDDNNNNNQPRHLDNPCGYDEACCQECSPLTNSNRDIVLELSP